MDQKFIKREWGEGRSLTHRKRNFFTVKHKIFKLLLVFYIEKYYNPCVKIVDKSNLDNTLKYKTSLKRLLDAKDVLCLSFGYFVLSEKREEP